MVRKFFAKEILFEQHKNGFERRARNFMGNQGNKSDMTERLNNKITRPSCF